MTQQNQLTTVRQLFEKSKSQIAMALPKHLTPERMMRVAMTAIQRTPGLLECHQTSIIGAVVEASQLGLEPDGALGHAYLVPFYNKKTRRKEAQLMVGYRGLIALARRSGEVQTIGAQVVYEKDQFEFSYGLEDKLDHTPALGDRGKPIAAYAVAKFKDGGHQFEVMSLEEIESIRKSSKAGSDGPWVTHWEEMARKTPLRRLAKYLPLSVEFVRAAVLDEYADAGIPQDLAAEVESAQAALSTQERTDQLKRELEEKRGGPVNGAAAEGTNGEVATITTDKALDLVALLEEHKFTKADTQALLKKFKATSIETLAADHYEAVVAEVQKKAK